MGTWSSSLTLLNVSVLACLKESGERERRPDDRAGVIVVKLMR